MSDVSAGFAPAYVSDAYEWCGALDALSHPDPAALTSRGSLCRSSSARANAFVDDAGAFPLSTSICCAPGFIVVQRVSEDSRGSRPSSRRALDAAAAICSRRFASASAAARSSRAARSTARLSFAASLLRSSALLRSFSARSAEARSSARLAFASGPYRGTSGGGAVAAASALRRFLPSRFLWMMGWDFWMVPGHGLACAEALPHPRGHLNPTLRLLGSGEGTGGGVSGSEG